MENKASGLCTLLSFFNFLAAERHLILGTAMLNQRTYFKGMVTSKFDSKDMLLRKRGSAFVSTEDRNLWIPSRLWFDQAGPPETMAQDSQHPKG